LVALENVASFAELPVAGVAEAELILNLIIAEIRTTEGSDSVLQRLTIEVNDKAVAVGFDAAGVDGEDIRSAPALLIFAFLGQIAGDKEEARLVGR